MRVAIDYTAALNQRAGIGRFVRNLVGSLLAVHGEDSFVLLHAALRGDDHPTLPAAAHVSSRGLPLTERWMTILWQRLRVPVRWSGPPGPSTFSTPRTSCCPRCGRALRVLTVHDLAFLLYPEVRRRAAA